MSHKKSHTVTVTEDQLRLLKACEDSPALLEKLTGVLNRFNQEVDGGMDAYNAESHIVDAVREIGQSMIGQWADKAQKVALDEAAKEPDLIKNGKKNSTGIAPSEG